MITARSHTTRKVMAAALSVCWMAGTITFALVDSGPEDYGFRSPEVEQRMQACTGAFQSRYKCKESAILEKGREDFVEWMGKAVIIFGPPALLFAVLHWTTRRTDDEDDDLGPPLAPPRPPNHTTPRVASHVSRPSSASRNSIAKRRVR